MTASVPEPHGSGGLEVGESPCLPGARSWPGYLAHGLFCRAFPAALMALVLIAASAFRLVLVDGESMLPTFDDGDLLIVNRFAYVRAEPRRDDIVVARLRNELIVKRVVGLPGEVVELIDGRLYINGRKMKELHAITPGELSISRGRLLRGRFALLGDNRSTDRDLAVHAVMPREEIVGKVVATLHIGPWTRGDGPRDPYEDDYEGGL
jgi:signal peptidase I